MKFKWTLRASVYTKVLIVTLNPWLCFGRNDVKTWLQSPIVTNWGKWGRGELCPAKTFVGAIELKDEEYQERGDDTALNGVNLLCINMNNGKEQKWISDKVASFGIWRGRKSCYNGLATGFIFKSEPYQRGGDDTAAVDMALICTSSNGSKTQLIGSGLHGWGRWTQTQHCPPNTAICGIKTQVEGYQGKGLLLSPFPRQISAS